jgi:hypothetical protein
VNIIAVLLGSTLVLRILKKRNLRSKHNAVAFDVFKVSDEQKSEAEDSKVNAD